jgi:hypothetical protein
MRPRVALRERVRRSGRGQYHRYFVFDQQQRRRRRNGKCSRRERNFIIRKQLVCRNGAEDQQRH